MMSSFSATLLGAKVTKLKTGKKVEYAEQTHAGVEVTDHEMEAEECKSKYQKPE